MAGVKKLTSYFKLLTKDEMEVNELLASQLSRNSRTASLGLKTIVLDCMPNNIIINDMLLKKNPRS